MLVGHRPTADTSAHEGSAGRHQWPLVHGAFVVRSALAWTSSKYRSILRLLNRTTQLEAHTPGPGIATADPAGHTQPRTRRDPAADYRAALTRSPKRFE